MEIIPPGGVLELNNLLDLAHEARGKSHQAIVEERHEEAETYNELAFYRLHSATKALIYYILKSQAR